MYQALLGQCDTAYVTKIHKSYPADCWLPDLDADPDWTLAEESEPLEEGVCCSAFTPGVKRI
ncbi:MAG: hypothetical protein V8S34_01450 [Lawsonibacter sp.]